MVLFIYCVFFKQKTAYEMRISDWSSDVCSSDLLVSAGMFNQVFTLHGTVMMFLFAVPIFEAVAIRLLPDMMGARDLPFPRLSAYGFWCFLIGGVFVCGSILFGEIGRAHV